MEKQTTPPRYSVQQVHSKPELDAIMSIIWAANYNPYEPFAQLFFPVLGFTPAAHAAAFSESQTRFWTNHTSTPTSNWYYVRDNTTGKPVGCAQWEVHSENPFKSGVPAMRAPWWPEGEYREFCEEIMRQIYSPRGKWMRRPHMGRWARVTLLSCELSNDC